MKEIECYIILKEVYDHQSKVRATETLFIGKSKITRSIQYLEKKLGEKIIYKKNGQYVLTKTGEECYKFALVFEREYVKFQKNVAVIHCNPKRMGMVDEDFVYFNFSHSPHEYEFEKSASSLVRKFQNGTFKKIYILNILAHGLISYERNTLRTINFYVLVNSKFLQNEITCIHDLENRKCLIAKGEYAREIAEEFTNEKIQIEECKSMCELYIQLCNNAAAFTIVPDYFQIPLPLQNDIKCIPILYKKAKLLEFIY